MQALFHSFFADTRTQIALLLVALDLVLGVIAGLVRGQFRLSFVADFARNDLLGKVVPFFGLYAGYLYAKHTDIVIPGLDLDVLMNGAWVLVSAALIGSLLNSLKDLGLLQGLHDSLAGPDPGSPAPQHSQQ